MQLVRAGAGASRGRRRRRPWTASRARWRGPPRPRPGIPRAPCRRCAPRRHGARSARRPTTPPPATSRRPTTGRAGRDPRARPRRCCPRSARSGTPPPDCASASRPSSSSATAVASAAASARTSMRGAVTRAPRSSRAGVRSRRTRRPRRAGAAPRRAAREAHGASARSAGRGGRGAEHREPAVGAGDPDRPLLRLHDHLGDARAVRARARDVDLQPVRQPRGEQVGAGADLLGADGRRGDLQRGAGPEPPRAAPARWSAGSRRGPCCPWSTPRTAGGGHGCGSGTRRPRR